MKNEIVISNKTSAFKAQLAESLEMMAEYNRTIDALKQVPLKGNETLARMIAEQAEFAREQLGYTLGLIKANLDSLPVKVAMQQRINEIPVDVMIKMKVDHEVLEQREKLGTNDMTPAKEYDKKYRRLSELICGYGYNCSFIPERFREFYPKGMHRFVRGFANGYSSALHTIAEEEGIKMQRTDPVTQDIWKNYPYFLDHGCREYSLEGKYLFMYHGGWNCSGNPHTPYGNNVQMINQNLYQKLQARDVSEFTSTEFDMNL